MLNNAYLAIKNLHSEYISRCNKLQSSSFSVADVPVSGRIRKGMKKKKGGIYARETKIVTVH